MILGCTLAGIFSTVAISTLVGFAGGCFITYQLLKKFK
jgi:hypothetical protein